MKNLLMIVPFFPPVAGGGVYRALSFVKYIGAYGWQPTVITPRPRSYWVTDDTLVGDVPTSCRIHYTSSASGQSVLSMLGSARGGPSQIRSSRGFGVLRKAGTFLAVPDTYVGWYPFAMRVARRVVREGSFNAIFSTSPPETSHLIGYRLHRSTGLPWVADFRDPWTNLHVLSPASPLHARIHRSLESRVCTAASAVVVTNRREKERLQQIFPDMRPPRVISNGYDHRKFHEFSGLTPAASPFRMTHTGALTESRSAIAFLRALRLFLDRTPRANGQLLVDFVGPREDANDREVARLGLERVVRFRNTVPHEDALRLLHVSHVLLLIALPHQMPGKLFEYIAAGRPILALTPSGEVSEIVETLRRGEVAPPDDDERIAERLAHLYERFASGTLDDGYHLGEVAAYQRETLAGVLAECLDEVASGDAAL